MSTPAALHHPFPTTLLFALLAAAQPAAAASSPNGSFALLATYSDRTNVERGGVSPGDVAVTALQTGFGMSTAIGPGRILTAGVDYGHFQLDRDARVPLPDQLQELSLPLALAGTLAADWQGRLQIRPGLYGTKLAFGGGNGNVPVFAFASWRQRADLSWTFGLRYDAWARTELLPFAGVNWKFAPAWEFAVGLPRTGVAWQFRPDAALRIGATVQGGSFHVAADPRPAGATGPALGDTNLDYREIRLGTALDLGGGGAWSLLLDAGAILSQRFEYPNRRYRLSGDAAAYGTLALRTRF